MRIWALVFLTNHLIVFTCSEESSAINCSCTQIPSSFSLFVFVSVCGVLFFFTRSFSPTHLISNEAIVITTFFDPDCKLLQ